MLTWQVMWQFHLLADIWANHVVTRGSFWQMVWCHVAQSWAATWHPFIGYGLFIKILWSPWGSNPGPPHHCQSLWQSPPNQRPHIVSCYVYGFKFI
jgi:hypothetical protein